MGAVRLSPPITILAIVSVALVVLAYNRPLDDCAYEPDGTPRDRTIGQVLKDRLIGSDDCDVWAGIVPRKKIETIELVERTKGGSGLIARINPSGSGFIAIIPPYSPQNQPLWTRHNPSVEQVKRYSSAFVIVQYKPSTYSAIVDLVGPMRDFQGGWLLDASNTRLAPFAELDDPQTRKILCRKSLDIHPVDHGPVITFRFQDSARPVYVSTGVNCGDAAQRRAKRRVSEAIARLIDDSDQAPAIEPAANKEYPKCESSQSRQPCQMMRL